MPSAHEPSAPQSFGNRPRGFLTFTLHAHLPYVVNHGTWPHGLEWLLEAAAETYLPLLRVFANLERDGLGLHCNLNLSPILLEQLAHPVFKTEFPRYLERKINAAQEDETFFNTTGESHYASTAHFWRQFFTDALDQFHALDGDIIAGFRHFHEAGQIDIITSGATHGYMPLLGTDESLRAQVRTAVSTHMRHIGSAPRGIWIPECGYRPAGFWQYPVAMANGAPTPPGCERIGVEQALAESDLQFFFVDTHLVESSQRTRSPYERQAATRPAPLAFPAAEMTGRCIYQPYFVAGSYEGLAAGSETSVFPRDPRTGLQVWSGDTGYPGDPNYLDFHKKRWPGGHRYWRVTGHDVDMQYKQPYFPEQAAERVREHAAHFVSLVEEALSDSMGGSVPPVLCAPFDAELFGHWWFEGAQWLEAIARQLHGSSAGISLTSCASYLDAYPRAGSIAMREGSWGSGGDNQVWLNADTTWTYERLYPAELYCREVCSSDRWRESGARGDLGQRVVKQLCRELLLLESSDWQFLITTGAARDYAEMRFNTHHDQFNELKHFWQMLELHGSLLPEQYQRIADIEARDSIFAEIDPALWAAGARATPAKLADPAPEAAATC